MSITHHPGDELLLSYASGAANEPSKKHIAIAPTCLKMLI